MNKLRAFDRFLKLNHSMTKDMILSNKQFVKFTRELAPIIQMPPKNVAAKLKEIKIELEKTILSNKAWVSQKIKEIS